MATDSESYDRAAEVNQFEASKLGVKGLVDSGITTIPRIFVHPPETLAELGEDTHRGTESIPTIDLSGLDSGERRLETVRQISCASREWGFFQIVNHGVQVEVMDRVIGAVKGFHELPAKEKARMYRREMETGVSFFSNVDLFHSKAASWRDTLQIRLSPKFADIDEIPEVCRTEVVDWDQHAQRVGGILLEILSEGLGLSVGRLQGLTCLGARAMVAHYCPQCPQPDLTVGISTHTDPGVITVLVQDQVGGLQVKHAGGWVDVKPIPGAIVINIGDILQIISNDEYKSVEHRVLANPLAEPRVSIGVFCNPSMRDREYGPIPELISPERPALFRHFTLADYMRRFFTKELNGMSLVNYYRDTLQIRLGPKFADIDKIPEVCRAEVVDWDRQVQQVGWVLLELLSEGLGLSAETLQELTCLGTRVMVAHYYPRCPQPELTVGIAGHMDPGVITLLVQDQVGGLQVKHGDRWVDVEPVQGAIVINIGDISQIMSNDEYKSVEHRVLANPLADPRVSIAVFCNPSRRDQEYGPLPELISPEKPALFRQFTFADYMRRFFTKELDGMSLVNYYRL